MRMPSLIGEPCDWPEWIEGWVPLLIASNAARGAYPLNRPEHIETHFDELTPQVLRETYQTVRSNSIANGSFVGVSWNVSGGHPFDYPEDISKVPA